MDQKKIESLMELMKKHGFNELEISGDKDKVKLVRHGGMAPMAAPMMSAPVPVAAAAAPVDASADKAGGLKPGQQYVCSPFVGTYYESPNPGSDAFVQIGQKITKGQVLCIVEAMKIMNEIEADVGGTVVKKLVKNEEPVEFDQPLFIVE